ncbi:hypothetical protein BGZ46_005521 [Entomortierella lignicola]|nr:hypothetical protein BGZ46_005521 [Entomortierella lignicola]
MSSNRKLKEPWRESIRSLPSKEYFLSCNHPHDLKYQDFLICSKGHLVGRARFRQEWGTAGAAFRQRAAIHHRHHQLLRDIAKKIDKYREKHIAVIHGEIFRQQQAFRRLLKGRDSVHDIADQVINKRKRTELENELRSHDEKHHSGDSVGKDVASQQQIGAINMQESTCSNDDHSKNDNYNNYDDTDNNNNYNSYDDDNDDKLTSGRRTPPRSVRPYSEEVPQVKDLEAVFHHVTDLNNFKLSAVDQDLYNEATLWFRSNNGRDAETIIQNIRNDPFWEPWVNDLLYNRLKLLRHGLNPQSDENTYTSYWVIPDFTALQTDVPGLIAKGFSNENHFVPSS